MNSRPRYAPLLIAALLLGAATTTLAVAEETDDDKEDKVKKLKPADDTGDADASTDAPPEPVSEETRKLGAHAFIDVAKVLQSPRCMNCHPDGDRPLQTDDSRPHAMNVSRGSTEAGLECATCHRTQNADAMGIVGGPPGAPNWHLPPKEHPMVFQGRTPAELCAQLKDPAQNGGKDLQGLLEHVSHDPLVLWGWDPGGERTLPPLDHDTFVDRFTLWVESRGACPK